MFEEALLGASSPTSGLESLLSGLGSFFGIFSNIILLGLLGFILYYNTGNDKKADKFMPRLMSVGVRLNSYIWQLVATFTVFAGLYSVLFYVLSKLIPGDNAFIEPEFEGLVRGLVVVLIGLLTFVLNYVIVSMIQSDEDKKGTVAEKVFVFLGLMIFSIVAFASTLTVALNLLDRAYDNIDYISASALAVMLGSVIFFGLYMFKAFKLNREEPR